LFSEVTILMRLVANLIFGILTVSLHTVKIITTTNYVAMFYNWSYLFYNALLLFTLLTEFITDAY
jgi:hypothetical protein